MSYMPKNHFFFGGSIFLLLFLFWVNNRISIFFFCVCLIVGLRDLIFNGLFGLTHEGYVKFGWVGWGGEGLQVLLSLAGSSSL